MALAFLVGLTLRYDWRMVPSSKRAYPGIAKLRCESVLPDADWRVGWSLRGFLRRASGFSIPKSLAHIGACNPAHQCACKAEVIGHVRKFVRILPSREYHRKSTIIVEFKDSQLGHFTSLEMV